MKRVFFLLAVFVFSVGIANAKEAKQSSETLSMELFGLTCHDVAVDYMEKVYNETGIAYSYAKDLCDYYNQ